MANTATKAVRAALKSRAARAAIAAVATMAEKAAHAAARKTVKGAARQVKRVVDSRRAAAKSAAAQTAAVQASLAATTAATFARSSAPAWTAPVLALGTTQVPNALLANHAELGLDAKDFVLLLHLWRRWDTRDGTAHCSVEQLARDSGIKRGGVQRRLKRLQTAGLLEKRPSQTADGEKVRRYGFQGLVQRTAAAVAPRKSAADSPAKPSPRAVTNQEKKARTRRKPPQLQARTPSKRTTAATPGSRKRATVSKLPSTTKRSGGSRSAGVRKTRRAPSAGVKR
ncbi:MAG TPA: helix-turn-helix domain-containing protein [Xanthomonadaceae bacterium]|nr:helix-turn-helix domain-containing protein [Xanthomonadaceae bacterium]